MSLPKKHRLFIYKGSLSVLRKKGRHSSTSLLNAFWTVSDFQPSRFAVIVGGIISKKATVRNRLRRVLHEAIRFALSDMTHVDMVIYPKKEILNADIATIVKEVGLLFKKLT